MEITKTRAKTIVTWKQEKWIHYAHKKIESGR